MTDRPGIELRRTTPEDATIDALGERHRRVGLAGVLDDLDRQARPSRLTRVLGRAVDEAYVWERRDVWDRQWWPQGITTSADAEAGEVVAGRRLLVTSWYAVRAVGHGSRITVLDLDTLRYRHVLLVTAVREADGAAGWRPLPVHAGGLAWCGPHLHVAATARGLVTCRVDDVLRAAGPGGARDHRYLLPVRLAHRAGTGEGRRPFRYSFVSLDRSTSPPGLVAGEYGRAGRSTRLVRFDLDGEGLPVTGPEGVSRPTDLADAGVTHMQGAVTIGGRHYVTTSHGPWLPGSVHRGAPGELARRRYALPMGPEDLSYWPSTDRLWSVTEHPGRRWVVAMDRSRLR